MRFGVVDCGVAGKRRWQWFCTKAVERSSAISWSQTYQQCINILFNARMNFLRLFQAETMLRTGVKFTSELWRFPCLSKAQTNRRIQWSSRTWNGPESDWRPWLSLVLDQGSQFLLVRPVRPPPAKCTFRGMVSLVTRISFEPCRPQDIKPDQNRSNQTGRGRRGGGEKAWHFGSQIDIPCNAKSKLLTLLKPFETWSFRKQWTSEIPCFEQIFSFWFSKNSGKFMLFLRKGNVIMIRPLCSIFVIKYKQCR